MPGATGPSHTQIPAGTDADDELLPCGCRIQEAVVGQWMVGRGHLTERYDRRVTVGGVRQILRGEGKLKGLSRELRTAITGMLYDLIHGPTSAAELIAEDLLNRDNRLTAKGNNAVDNGNADRITWPAGS
ncbi:hypothetical protein H2203_003805 [Taxawa tesnikishii (nom. ined.)]|nr:hypothetical protein H2203_003805 [Dothideales sp. JES 119]